MLMQLLDRSDKLKKILTYICTFFILLILHCNMEIVADIASDSRVLRFANKFAGSFNSYNFTDIFTGVAVFCLITYVVRWDKVFDKCSGLFSLFLSSAYVLSNSYKKYNSAEFLTQNRYQVFLGGTCILGLGILFYFLLRFLIISIEKNAKPLIQTQKEKGIYRFGEAIFISWLLWILMNYPGSFCPDSQNQLKQFYGELELTAHHPPLSTFIMGGLVVIGDSFIDKNFGCFLYLLLQTSLGVLIISYGLRKLYNIGISRQCCFIGELFFALTPLWGCFAQWYEKDLLYTEFTALFLFYLWDIVYKRACDKKDVIRIILVSVLTSLLRNNGIYAIIPTLFVLVFYVKGISRKRVMTVLGITISLYVVIVKGIYPSMVQIEKGAIKEALSIPFMQTARYIVEYGEEVTEDEKEVINRTLNYEKLPEVYNPVISDRVKTAYRRVDATLPNYFKVWFQMFWKHPNVYLSALINISYGYLAPVEQDIEAWVQTEYGEKFLWLQDMGIHRIFGELPTGIFAQIRSASMELPLVKYLCMPGMYTWVLLICMYLLIKRKAYSALILFVPEIMNLLVCVASPLANAIRYELPTVAAVPFLVGWTYYFVIDDLKILDWRQDD